MLLAISGRATFRIVVSSICMKNAIAINHGKIAGMCGRSAGMLCFNSFISGIMYTFERYIQEGIWERYG